MTRRMTKRPVRGARIVRVRPTLHSVYAARKSSTTPKITSKTPRGTAPTRYAPPTAPRQRRGGEHQPGRIVDALEARVRGRPGKRVEKHDGQRDRCHACRLLVRIDQQQHRHEHEAAAGADQRAVRAHGEPQRHQQQFPPRHRRRHLPPRWYGAAGVGDRRKANDVRCAFRLARATLTGCMWTGRRSVRNSPSPSGASYLNAGWSGRRRATWWRRCGSGSSVRRTTVRRRRTCATKAMLVRRARHGIASLIGADDDESHSPTRRPRA